MGKVVPDFFRAGPAPAGRAVPDRNSRRPETGRRLSSAVPRGCWPSFLSVHGSGGAGWAARAPPHASLRISGSSGPPLPLLLLIQLSLRPQAEQVKDQRHRQQEDGHPGHRSAGVHQGGPVLELHQMLVVEDLQNRGPGAGRHAEETGQPCPVPARLSPGEIHR